MRILLPEASQLLQNGHVVAVPTETVYGLAASLCHSQAIQQIFSLKGRPSSNPLIIHVADPASIQEFTTELPPQFDALAQTFWPGPLTLILPIHPTSILPSVRANLSTAGFRVPSHQLALELLRETGPLVMPSANLSGRPSATLPEHVEEDFGSSLPILDGGACTQGLESTILMYQKTRWVILRLGALAPEAFEKVLGYQPDVITTTSTSRPLCPGQLFRHYAPKAKLLLGKDSEINDAPFILGFKERQYPSNKTVIHLGSLNNPEEVAERLYQVLRQLDREGADQAWVDMDFPAQGLWMTIAERLHRAGEG